jgi:hypothetical protein
MELSSREIWALVHGIILGAVFLSSYGASMVWFSSYKQEMLSNEGSIIRKKRMVPVIWILCIVCWLTVISGTFISYPGYRAIPPYGADLVEYPRQFLLSSSRTEMWHKFGMEWKEHIAWLSPFIFTAVAFIATLYGEVIAKNNYIRKALMLLLTLAFVAAGTAALLGALITKKAPVL